MKLFLQWVLKGILIALAVLGVLFFLVANFSVISEEFICDGELRHGSGSQPDRAFVVLDEYRWWVRLWSDNHGQLKAQFDKLTRVEYVPRIRKIGDGFLAIYSFFDENHKNFLGGLQAANGELTLNLLDNLVFVGICKTR